MTSTIEPISSLDENTFLLYEEWMYTNVFLVDLESAFARWRLIHTSLPHDHVLKSFIANSLQATSKLRALYLTQEEKRPDLESQLRSWVNKVEASLKDVNVPIQIKNWTTMEEVPPILKPNPPEKPSSLSGLQTSNIFGMESWYEEERSLDDLIATVCPTQGLARSGSISKQPVNQNSNSSSSYISTKNSDTQVGIAVSTATTGVSPSGASTPLSGSASIGASSKRNTYDLSGTSASSLISSSSNPSLNNNPESTTTSETLKNSSFVHILIELNDMIMWIGQEIILYLSLWSEDRYISEEHIIHVMGNQTPIPIDEKHRRVIFRDVPTDAANNNLHLVARLVRIGKMKYQDSKGKDSGSGNPYESGYYTVKKPFAISVMNISKVLKQVEDEVNSSQLYPWIPPPPSDSKDASSDTSEPTTDSSLTNSGRVVGHFATMRRRQFSNTTDNPRVMNSSNRVSSRLNKSTLRTSAMRSNLSTQTSSAQQSFINAWKNLNYIQSSQQFMTLFAPSKEDIFSELHEHLINGTAEKNLLVSYLPKAKGLLVTVSKFDGQYSAVEKHPAFSQAQPLTSCLPLTLYANELYLTGSNQVNSRESAEFTPRNDLYITLDDAIFHDGKNFEILVEVRNKFGLAANLSPAAIQSIQQGYYSHNGLYQNQYGQNQSHSSPSPTLVHRSIAYYHKKDPKFSETFKVDLNRYTDADHLFLAVRKLTSSKPGITTSVTGYQGSTLGSSMISTTAGSPNVAAGINGGSGPGFQDVAFSTLRLFQSDSSFITNGPRKLNVNKPTPPTVGSSTLNSTNILTSGSASLVRATVVGSGSQSNPSSIGTSNISTANLLSSAFSNSNSTDDTHLAWYLKNEDALVRTNKADCINLTVNLVSTKITENIPLRALLNWQNSSDPDIRPLLLKCANLSKKDILNFYKDIFDTLIEIIVLLDDETRYSAFDTLMSILVTCLNDPSNIHYEESDLGTPNPNVHLSLKYCVDNYLSTFSNVLAWPILIDLLLRTLTSLNTQSSGNKSAMKNTRPIRLAVKSAPLILMFILKSKQVSVTTGGASPAILPKKEKKNPGITPAAAAFASTGLSGYSSGSLGTQKAPHKSILTTPITPTNTHETVVDVPHKLDEKDTESDLAHWNYHKSGSNPLLPSVKDQKDTRWVFVRKDTSFIRKWLSLLDNFSSILESDDPIFTSTFVLLPQIFPRLLQVSTLVLSVTQISVILSRFLDAIDEHVSGNLITTDSASNPLNMEKLWFLQLVTFSPYVDLSFIIKHVRTHLRQATEERIFSLHVIKLVCRSLLHQYLKKDITALTPVASLTDLPDSIENLNSKPPPAQANQSSHSKGTRPLWRVLLDLLPGLAKAAKRLEESDVDARRDISSILFVLVKIAGVDRIRTALLVASAHQDVDASLSRSISSAHLSKIGSQANLQPGLGKKALLAHPRRQVISASSSVNKSESVSIPNPQPISSRDIKAMKKILISLTKLVETVLRYSTYPLGWPDLILLTLRSTIQLTVVAVVPALISLDITDKMDDSIKSAWLNIFSALCFGLRHPAIQLESYVTKRDDLLKYMSISTQVSSSVPNKLEKEDIRVPILKSLWSVWNHFENFRIQLIPSGIPGLLAMSSSPNQIIAGISRFMFSGIAAREADLHTFYLESPFPELISVPLILKNSSNKGRVSHGSIPENPGRTVPNQDDAVSRIRSNIAIKPVMAKQTAVIGETKNQSSNLSSLQNNLLSVTTMLSPEALLPAEFLSQIIGNVSMTTGGIKSHESTKSNTILQQKTSQFSQLEIATIQSLEDLSKTSNWNQNNLIQWFGLLKDLNTLQSESTNSINRSTFGNTSSSSNTSSPRSSSGSADAPISQPFGLTLKSISKNISLLFEAQTSSSQTLPRVKVARQHLKTSLLERVSTSKHDQVGWAISSPSFYLGSHQAASTKWKTFCHDMINLVELLGSLRELPRGSEYDEERAYALTELMTYLRQTDHADAYLKYASQLAKLYEEASQFTEAAYAVLLHADMLDWSTRLVPVPPDLNNSSGNIGSDENSTLDEVSESVPISLSTSTSLSIASSLSQSLLHVVPSSSANSSSNSLAGRRPSRKFSNNRFSTFLNALVSDTPDAITQPAVSRTTTSRNLKLSLMLQAMNLFNKGKAWEDAIRVSGELVHAMRTVLFDFQGLAAQLRVQADLYSKIAEQDRFFSNYFYVAYYGAGFPSALRRKSFIYRGLELERIPHFISRMQKKFPNAEVLTSMDPPPSELTDKNKEKPGQFIQIFTVQPASEEEMLGKQDRSLTWRLNMALPQLPEGARKYYANNNVKVFQYSRPFRPATTQAKPVQPGNEFINLWISQVFLQTEDTFPSIQRRLEIVKTKENIRPPVENAALAVISKNEELAEILSKLAEHTVKVDRLSMALTGILDAAVNGGTAKYTSTFLSQSYISEADKKSLESISKLKSALFAQVTFIRKGLDVHRELIPENLIKLHQRLESQYTIMEAQMLAFQDNAQQTQSNPPQSTLGNVQQLNNVPAKGAIRIKDPQTDSRPRIKELASNFATK